MHLPQLFHLNI